MPKSESELELVQFLRKHKVEDVKADSKLREKLTQIFWAAKKSKQNRLKRMRRNRAKKKKK